MSPWERFVYSTVKAAVIAYLEVRARYESATRELPPDETDTARAARIAAAIRGLSPSDRPPG